MQQLKSFLDISELIEALKHIDYHLDGSGAYMAAQPNDDRLKYLFPEAVLEIETLRKLSLAYVMLNKLPRNTRVPVHRDWIKPTKLQSTKPCIERWHLPILTNDDCIYWDASNGEVQMQVGYWHGPIPYWREHFVENAGVTDRVHLVVDLDCEVSLGNYDD